MQLVLVETSVAPRTNDLIIDKRVIRQTLSAYKQDRDDKYRAMRKALTEMMNIEDNTDGSLRIATGWVDGLGNDVISVIPSVPERSIFKVLVQAFQEKVRISLFVEWYIPECGTIVGRGKAQGMKIDPKAFSCTGNYLQVIMPVRDMSPMVFVQLVADIGATIPREHRGYIRDFPCTIPSGVSSAQKILEEGEHSDVIISAGNGAEIKAHKLFLSVASPVLKAMLKSGMVESETGRVDMSDLSEEGVRAFLRYVYYDDLREPRKNLQVAFDLLCASHKYDVSSQEAKMNSHLLDANNKDIDVNLAFKIYMFTRNISAAVELKTKAIKILKSSKLDQLFANHNSGESALESEIESFMAAGNKDDLDVALAFKMYILFRNIESAAELKNKAFQVLKTKWRELELLQEYNQMFEKPCNAKIVKELCRDIWMALAASS